MLYGEKIELGRKSHGWSQEEFADRLHIAQNTYSDLVNHKSKLTVDMLLNIAKELEVDPMKLISDEPAVINFGTMHGSMQYVSHIENFYSYQKEMLDSFKQIVDAVVQSNERILKLLEERK